jgi:hypothetical protein
MGRSGFIVMSVIDSMIQWVWMVGWGRRGGNEAGLGSLRRFLVAQLLLQWLLPLQLQL